MSETTWYLGPLGGLRALECPETDVVVDPVRFGGVRTALSGASTVDTTGVKMEYEFEFRYLTQDEYAWLDVLNSRIVPGPFYLIDPLRKNRLPMEAQNLKLGVTDPESVAYWRHEFETGQEPVSGVGFPVRTLKILGIQEGRPWRANPIIPIPVMPEERICGSVWMKASAPIEVEIGFDYYINSYERDEDPGAEATSVEVGTSWERYYFSAQLPSTTTGVKLYVLPHENGGDLSFAAPQVEASASPTEWATGGGGLQVAMTDLRATSPRFPYRTATLTLLEA